MIDAPKDIMARVRAAILGGLTVALVLGTTFKEATPQTVIIPQETIPHMIVCGDADTVRSSLKEKYNEETVWSGLTHDDAVMTLYQAENGTWAVVGFNAHGAACLFTFGTDGQITKGSLGAIDPATTKLDDEVGA